MYEGDRISDLLAVLAEVRREHRKEGTRPRELRIGAVDAVASRETDRGRFKNLRSARNTVNDALARRFGVRSLQEFDAMLGEWLRGKSRRLERTALDACWNEPQRQAVRAFFT